jgi:hypothetical protein
MGPKGSVTKRLGRGFVGVLVLATFFLGISPAYGRTVIENFDNNTYNHTLFWVNTSGTPNQPAVTVVDEHLQVTISGPITGIFAAGLQMTDNLVLAGDFDLQVDFNLVAWPLNSGVGAGIVSPLFDVRRVAADGQEGVTETYFFGIPGQGITTVTTGDMSGKLRLKRTGSTVQAFYWVPAISSWQSIGDPVTDATLAAPTSAYIGIYSRDFTVEPPLTVTFDNYKIMLPDATAATAGLLLLLE